MSFGPGNNIPILEHYGTLNKKSSFSAGLISLVQHCVPVIIVFHVIGLSSLFLRTGLYTVNISSQ